MSELYKDICPNINLVVFISKNKEVVVLMDTTYWGWKFGVVVMNDVLTKKTLWHKYINRKETLQYYQESIFF
ncbi:MAG: hypothetical protein LBR28_01940 [Bacteroidales bacterium]|nr:hypothetical protein [Bacteroidales bacterium]